MSATAARQPGTVLSMVRLLRAPPERVFAAFASAATELSRVHRGLPGDAACRRHEWGWSGALNKLPTLVESTTGGTT